MQAKRLISIIVPVYNEAANLRPLHAALQHTTDSIANYNFEMLYVDDGSQDESASVLMQFTRNRDNAKVIQFSRNFGKEAAVSAGLHAAKGDAAIVIDADMQMPPSLIGEFIRRWERGAEVVVGVFATRNMHFLRKMGAKLFYRIMQSIGNTKITPHATDYRLLDREVIDTFNQFSERNRITRGLIDWLGFRCSYVPFEQATRLHGSPTYSFSKLINLAMNSFTGYSLFPLKLAGYVGVTILALSVPLGIFMYVIEFIFNDPFHWAVSGTFFLAILLLALVGIVLACLGLISLYIAHIHTEVIDRPLYVVRKQPKIKDEELAA